MKLLTVEEVAEQLAVNARTVRNLIKNGELEFYKVGGVYRIDEQDFQTYLNKIRNEKGD